MCHYIRIYYVELEGLLEAHPLRHRISLGVAEEQVAEEDLQGASEDEERGEGRRGEAEPPGPGGRPL